MDRKISILDGKTDITNAPGLHVIAQHGKTHVSDDGSVSRVDRNVCLSVKWPELSDEERQALLLKMNGEVRQRFLASLSAA